MILDGYAGAGGWDEGARRLGLAKTIGIDNWWDACATAKAAGHARIQADVSAYPTDPFAGRVEGVILSPPCQPFSAAGAGRGKFDRPRIHALVDRMADGDDRWQDMTWEDDRSHHAAQPVRWVRDLRPEWVALEQVKEVLPLWEHIGRVLSGWGYSVWTGRLNAADYGVPQARIRAVLIASRVSTVGQPTPTHYDTARLPGLFGEPWVTLSQALGWPGADRPARTITGNRGPRWAYQQGNSYATGRTVVGCQVGPPEAAILQGFRPDYPWHGNKTSRFHQIANAVPPGLAAAVIAEAAGLPAITHLERAA